MFVFIMIVVMIVSACVPAAAAPVTATKVRPTAAPVVCPSTAEPVSKKTNDIQVTVEVVADLLSPDGWNDIPVSASTKEGAAWDIDLSDGVVASLSQHSYSVGMTGNSISGRVVYAAFRWNGRYHLFQADRSNLRVSPDEYSVISGFDAQPRVIKAGQALRVGVCPKYTVYLRPNGGNWQGHR